jgi:hypothetical protein
MHGPGQNLQARHTATRTENTPNSSRYAPRTVRPVLVRGFARRRRGSPTYFGMLRKDLGRTLTTSRIPVQAPRHMSLRPIGMAFGYGPADQYCSGIATGEPYKKFILWRRSGPLILAQRNHYAWVRFIGTSTIRWHYVAVDHPFLQGLPTRFSATIND